MKYILTISGLISFFFGFDFWLNAKGAMHQIVAVITVLIGAVFFTGSAITEAIQKKRLE